MAPPPGMAQSPWTVDSLPFLHIPGTAPNGDFVFERAAGATRLSDGTIVIAEPTAGSVRFFDSTGQWLRTVGRPGRGPGEFGYISWLGQCSADSVFVWDFRQHRMTVIGRDGSVARQYQLPPTPGAGPVPARLSCTRTGSLAVLGQSGSLPPGAEKSSGSYMVPLVIEDTRGRVLQSLGEVRGHEYAMDRAGNVVARPLGKVTAVAVSRDRLYIGTAESPSIDIHALDGRRLATLRLQLPRRPTTKQHYDRSVDDVVAYVPNLDMRAGLKRQFLSIPMPPDLPPYTGLFVDPDQLLWVVLSVKGDADTRLRAVRDDGTVVADVRIPTQMTVFEIGTDYILGAYEDDDGEPHLVLHRLRRGSRATPR